MRKKNLENIYVNTFFMSLAVLFIATASNAGWQLETLPALEPGGSYDLSDIKSLSTGEAWISGGLRNGGVSTGEAFVLKTTDGTNWSLIFRKGADTDPWQSFAPFNRLSLVDSNTAWVGGSNGLTAFTANGGSSWSREAAAPCNPSSPAYPPTHVYGLKAVNATNVWTGGWDNSSLAGVIWHRPYPYSGDCTSLNYYLPYRLESVQGQPIIAIDSADASNAWAVLSSGILHTTIGGDSWTQVASPTGRDLTDVAVVNSNVAWVVGAGGGIAKTSDGGSTWVVQGSGVDATLQKITAVSEQVAWAVGNGGTIVKTIDGGATWHPQISNTTEDLVGVTARDGNSVWAIGTNQTLLHATDGGQNQELAAPAVSSVEPVGGPATGGTSVDVRGSNFLPGCQVKFGGTMATIVQFNASWLRVTTAAHSAGIVDIEVRNPDGQVMTKSNAFAYGGTQPLLMSLSPLYATAGASSTTLYAYGAVFTINSVINWNNSPLATTYDYGTLYAAIPAANLISPGTATITVTNEGETSNNLPFSVNYGLVSFARPNPYPGPVSVTVQSLAGATQFQFLGVNSEGSVRVDTAQTQPPGYPPAGLQFMPKRYLDITTSSSFNYSSVEICFPYSEDELAASGLTENQLRILKQNADEITWDDVTTSRSPETNMICGTNVGKLAIPSRFAFAGPLPLPGDSNHDGFVDLTDTVLILQVLGGFTPSQAVFIDADVDGDGKLGIAEVIYSLQRLLD